MSYDAPRNSDRNGLALATSAALDLSRLPNVVVTRSFSKSYALAGLRFGFAVAQPDVIRELMKIKDSYNCDALSLIAENDLGERLTATPAVVGNTLYVRTEKHLFAFRENAP